MRLSEIMASPDMNSFYKTAGEVMSQEFGYDMEFTGIQLSDYARVISYTVFEPVEGEDEAATIELVIYQEWKSDGSATKPVTTVRLDGIDYEDEIRLGRMPIWNDPTEYGKSLGEIGEIATRLMTMFEDINGE